MKMGRLELGGRALTMIGRLLVEVDTLNLKIAVRVSACRTRLTLVLVLLLRLLLLLRLRLRLRRRGESTYGSNGVGESDLLG
jgi:hypothetical protein